jgi:putative ABC transport system permease protein
MIGHYLSVAIRNFRRHKFLTTIKVVALCVGLACFVGAHVLIHYLDSTDRQFTNSDRIVVMRQATTRKTTGERLDLLPAVAPPLAKALKAEFPELPAVARSDDSGDIAVKVGESKSFRHILYADADFLKIFDFDFVAGGGPDALAQPKSVILTVDAAKAIFGTADVLGRSMRLGNLVDVRVTGVMRAVPAPSHLGRSLTSEPFEILASMDVGDTFSRASSGEAESELNDWSSNMFTAYVLLPADGSLTLAAFNRRLKGFGGRHVPQTQVVSADFDAIPLPDLTKSLITWRYLDGATGPSLETLLYLMGGLILFVACLDFANVATAETTGRSKEVGLRRVLGAGGGQVAAQSLTEAALLVLFSALIAFAVITFCIRLMNRPADIGMRLPGAGDIGFWLFLLAVLSAVTLAAGGYPAAVLARIRPVVALRAGRAGGSRSVRTILVTLQFAAASLLFVSVAVMYGNMKAIEAAALGRTQDPYVLIGTHLGAVGIDPDVFRSQLLADPRIKAVTYSQIPLLMGGYGGVLELSRGAGAADPILAVLKRDVGENYFQTLEIPFLAGRAPSPERAGDVGPATQAGLFTAQKAPNLVIDRATAAGLGWSDPAKAVGETLYMHVPVIPGLNPQARLIPAEVIGVIENAPFQVTAPISTDFIYYLQPMAADLPIVRIDKSDVKGALTHIDDLWNRLAPNSPMRRSFMDEQLARALSLYETISKAFIALALFAIFIAAMGLIGMASYVVGRRVKEIGIRKTLGATTTQVLARLLWEFSRPVLVANLIAWPIAYVAMQSYLSLFSMRQSLTFLPFLVTLLATLALTWAAVLSQAWRAARVKPAKVLRYE